MSLVIEISEDRLRQLLIESSEIGAERALRRTNRELRFRDAKWLTKEETLEMLGVSVKQLRILTMIGAITSNDSGSGKRIHYDKASVQRYLANPGAWDDKKRTYHQLNK